MLRKKIEQVKNEFSSDIAGITSAGDLEKIRIKYLGRNGIISELFEQLKGVSKKDKPEAGKNLNQLRIEVTTQLQQLKSSYKLKKEKEDTELDLTLPGKQYSIGSKHILTQTLDEIKAIFKGRRRL